MFMQPATSSIVQKYYESRNRIGFTNTSYSFTYTSMAQVPKDGVVVLAVVYLGTATNKPTSVTIDGVAMSEACYSNYTPNGDGCALYYVDSDSLTDVSSVVVNFGTSESRSVYTSMYLITGINTVTPYDTAAGSDLAGNPTVPLSLDVVAGKAFIDVCMTTTTGATPSISIDGVSYSSIGCSLDQFSTGNPSYGVFSWIPDRTGTFDVVSTQAFSSVKFHICASWI